MTDFAVRHAEPLSQRLTPTPSFHSQGQFEAALGKLNANSSSTSGSFFGRIKATLGQKLAGGVMAIGESVASRWRTTSSPSSVSTSIFSGHSSTSGRSAPSLPRPGSPSSFSSSPSDSTLSSRSSTSSIALPQLRSSPSAARMNPHLVPASGHIPLRHPLQNHRHPRVFLCDNEPCEIIPYVLEDGTRWDVYRSMHDRREVYMGSTEVREEREEEAALERILREVRAAGSGCRISRRTRRELDEMELELDGEGGLRNRAA